MVQSLELDVKGDASPGSVRPPTIDGAACRPLQVYQQRLNRTVFNQMRTVVDQTARLGNYTGNGVVAGYGDLNRMSRQGGKGPTPAVPGAVAQQAQQYLEQNIMAWMQPKPQGQQILSSTLSSLSGQSSNSQMSQKALHEHNKQQPSPAGTASSSQASPSLAGTSCVGMPPSSIPHSLSFSGYSHHSLMQGTSFSSPCPSTFGAAQPSAAASFFARAAQRLNLSSRKRRRHQQQHHPDAEPPAFLTNFAEILRVSPPPAPPALLKCVGRRDNFCIGKVKVMLRIKGCESDDAPSSPFLNVDARKKQITVYDQLTTNNEQTRTTGVSAPKMFAFDAIFPPEDTQAEVCSSSLPDVIQAVVGGSDGCLFVYGHSKLGKTHTMVGSSDSAQELGILPSAISWLFRLIHEQRQKTGARFSVRVSALELSGRNEVLRDLLSEYAAGTEGSGTSPGVYLRDDPIFGAQLINQSELRAPTAEKAAYLLDAALAARTRDNEDEGRNSHFLFTLHLYQYRVERGGKGGVAGGRSRLHLFDLESCDKSSSKPRDGGSLSLSALGNVILALFNGQKHVPYKESKLTQLLKEAMSSLTCRVAMIAHISSQLSHYSEILGTIQLASRVHRMRRKKIKYPNVPMDSTDEKGVCVRPYVRMHAEDNVKSGNSDPDYTSSSEQSCDTVIYVGHLSHNENFTDNEGPPTSLPIVPKLKQSQNKSAHNTDTSTLERKRHNSVSKTQNNADDQRKSEEKSNTLTHNSTADTHHYASLGKSTKPDKNQPNSKSSPMSSRHQPASTQTLGSENAAHGVKSAQNSPLHTQRKTKHRSSQAKQDQATGIDQTAKGQSPAKTVKKQSDETWIDGPRFLKPKFDSKTLHQLQKEQWVDGPPNVYGFMDHHKQDMIQRWIEEHSKQQQNAAKKKNNEVWIDYPSSTEKDTSNESHKNTTDAPNGTSAKEKPCSKVKHANGEVTGESEIVRTISLAEINSLQRETEIVDDEADSASNSADVDETDNEENAEAVGYDADLHILQIAQSDAQSQSLHTSLSANTFPASLQEGYVETIEVFEPEEPVPMVDSCLQVTEEDILAEYWMQRRRKSSENPLPEVDQSSCDSKSHPLRILSEEYLNLPSSFTDSRSVNLDLDSISVPDMREGLGDRGAVTWRLLYGNMFQRIKEQQQLKQRKTIDDIDVTNSDVNNKLERIAKLRELIRPLTRHRSQTKVESIFKTCSINRLSSSGSRYTMPEILDGSRDSSMEDLSAAEVTSTQSEPADLDFDKLDYKLNIKPMNGLKLEEFYKKIQKVPPFLEQYSSIKPTQIVSPITYEQEKIYLNKLEAQRSDSTTFLNNIEHKQFSNTTNFKSSIDGTSKVGIDQKHQSTCSLQQTSSTSYIHKPSSTSNLQRESAKFSSSENTIPTRVQRTTTDHTELQRRTSDKKDSKKSLDSNETKRCESKTNSKNSNNKNVDTTMLTVGQSPSSNSKTRLHRGKIKNGDGQSIHSQQPLTQSSSSSLWSKDSSTSSSTTKPPHRSGFHPNGSSRGPNSKCHLGNCNSPVNNGKTSKTVNNNNASCKFPTRSSPTSSSTSGVTTMCCSGKPKDKTSTSKSKPLQSHSKQKQSAKSQRTKSICRSTSSPSTCVDSGDTVITDFTDSEHYHAVRHASVSGALASPYHKVPHVHVSRHHQRTSSGHGSESSVTSIEPREAKELLVKGVKTQQFSGTSSGYESMLRDSEGTPLSSSQESGNEDSERGRRGRRRSNGSSKRSSSAPARSPPSPLGPSAAIHQQPLPNRSTRRTDRSLHRSDEEVCCTSLLCCRLLDFY